MSRPRIQQKVPDDFKLSTYEVCGSWGLKEWVYALSVRFRLRENWVLACCEGKDSLVPSAYIDANKTEARNLFTNPLGGDAASLSADDNFTSPIKDQTVADFFEGHSYFIDPAYDFWARRFELSQLLVDDYTQLGVSDAELTEMARSGAEICSIQPAWAMHKEAAGVSGPFFIAVDLGAPDDYLQNEFKAWLKNIRKVTKIGPIRRAVTEDDFDRWHRQRVLPYLDLTYWARVEGLRFSIPILAEALFGDHFDDGIEDMLRRTIQPRAESLMVEEFLRAMTLQLLIEQPKAS